MSTDSLDQDVQDQVRGATEVDVGVLGVLPKLNSRQVRLEERLARLSHGAGLPPALTWLEEWSGPDVTIDRPEILWRASGLRRPGVIAQLTWPRLATRVGLGIDPAIAHAIVDRLLGFGRLDAESRLQLTPVEWGVLSFVIARSLEGLRRQSGPLGPWDLSIDRVGPDPFDPKDLGDLVTIRWPLRLGQAAGAARLWLPETLLASWLQEEIRASPEEAKSAFERLAGVTATWRAEAGTIAMPRGLAKLRVGGVLPLIDSRLRGSPQNPTGPVELALAMTRHGGRYWFPAEPAPFSGGGRIKLTEPLSRTTVPREPLAVNPPTDSTPSASAGLSPTDVPVTLVIELGRVNLSLGRLADLKPGDVLELGRHSREPVELTSGGRLVARGELVQIDTELGVRVTNVFL